VKKKAKPKKLFNKFWGDSKGKKKNLGGLTLRLSQKGDLGNGDRNQQGLGRKGFWQGGKYIGGGQEWVERRK